MIKEFIKITQIQQIHCTSFAAKNTVLHNDRLNTQPVICELWLIRPFAVSPPGLFAPVRGIIAIQRQKLYAYNLLLILFQGFLFQLRLYKERQLYNSIIKASLFRQTQSQYSIIVFYKLLMYRPNNKSSSLARRLGPRLCRRTTGYLWSQLAVIRQIIQGAWANQPGANKPGGERARGERARGRIV